MQFEIILFAVTVVEFVSEYASSITMLKQDAPITHRVSELWSFKELKFMDL